MMTLPAFRRRLSRLHRDGRGQAAFEFLLMLPFLILFILLAVDMGMLMYEYVAVNNAAREGARYAAVNGADASCAPTYSASCVVAAIQQRTVDRSSGIVGSTSEVTVAYRDISADGVIGRGDSVVVKVNHTYQMLFFSLPGGALKPIPVYACSDFRLEQKDLANLSGQTGSAC